MYASGGHVAILQLDMDLVHFQRQLNSVVCSIFVQDFAKKTSELSIFGPLRGEYIKDRCIPLTKGT